MYCTWTKSGSDRPAELEATRTIVSNRSAHNDNGLLRKKNIIGIILKQKGTGMAEDGED